MKQFISIAIRELRGGIRGFKIFIICIALGSMALATITSIKKAIDVGLDKKGVEALGGDISVKITYRFATIEEINFIETHSNSFTETTNFRSMAVVIKNNEIFDSTLIQIKGVDKKYPLYGEIKLIPEIYLSEALNKSNGLYGVVVAKSLMDRLTLKLGDKIKIGNNFFQIHAQLGKEPDVSNTTFSFAPKVIAYNTALIESGLLGLGTMFDTDYRLEAPDFEFKKTKQAAEEQFKESGMRWRDSKNAAPGIDRFVDRLTSFLLLIGMAGMAIGGIGIALSVTVYLEMKRNTIATLKTLGAADTTIFNAYFLIILVIAIGSSTIGAIIGALLPLLLEPFIASRFPIPIMFGFYYQPLFFSMFYGILTATLFSIWPLGRMLNNSVTNLFQNFSNQTQILPNLGYQILTGFTLVFLVLSFSLPSPKPLISISVFCGIAISLLGLLGMARTVRAGCAILSKYRIFKNNIKTHLALSSLGGPNNEIALTTLAVGFGLIVLATVGQIDYNLRTNINSDLADRGPKLFLIDIQPSQLTPLKKLIINAQGVEEFSSAPMLRGIISKVNGIPAKTFVGDHWAIRGDRGLTYSQEPPEHATVVRGKWWEPNYNGDPLISFAEEEASEMGISLGDKLTINVLGRDIVGTVTNFRDVDFATMRINFLMVFNPSALDMAPHSYIATIYAQDKSEIAMQKKITQTYPNITVIPMRDTLAQVSETLATIAAITRWSSMITIVIGFVVLVGVAGATEKKRSYEASLLKTLGANNSQILISFTLRSFIVGLGTGLMAIVLANLASWIIVSGFMGSPFKFDLNNATIIILAGVVTNGIAGLIFARKPLLASISQNLRNKD